MQSSGPLPLIKKFLKKKEEGFSLIELVVVVAVLSALSAVAIPRFNCFQRKAKASTALAALRQIQTECAVNTASTGSSSTYSTGNLNSYQIQSNGSNSCNGAQNTGLITAIPNNTSQLPTFILATNSNELTYSFRGQTGTNFTDCLGLLCQTFRGNGVLAKVEEADFTYPDTYIERGCYAFVLVDGPNWEDAQENAEELGGHLVTVNDEDENQWLVDKFSLADRETSTWIGLKINNEGDWEWASGQDSSYRGWDDVEPNNSDYQGRSEEFGAIRGSGKWNDLHNTRLADAGTGQGIAEVPICD